MATSFLTVINGIGRMSSAPGTSPIYDQSVAVVTSGATPPGSVTGPVTAGVAIALPASGSYTVVSGVSSLSVYLNGDRLEMVYDWTTSGAGPNYTAITFTFGLVAGDRIDFRMERPT